jgi:hypothetical protein
VLSRDEVTEVQTVDLKSCEVVAEGVELKLSAEVTLLGTKLVLCVDVT